MTTTATSNPLSDKASLEIIASALLRIAAALEAQAEEDETLTFPLADYRNFDWTSVGMSVVSRDDDGPAIVRTPNGKMAKRRSKDKFGTDIWFSYVIGKTPEGTPKYHRVIEFRDVKMPEQLERKTATAATAQAAAGISERAPVGPAEPPQKAAAPAAVQSASKPSPLASKEAMSEHRNLMAQLMLLDPAGVIPIRLRADGVPPPTAAEMILINGELERLIAAARTTPAAQFADHPTATTNTKPVLADEIVKAREWLKAHKAGVANAMEFNKLVQDCAKHGYAKPAKVINLLAIRADFEVWLSRFEAGAVAL